MHLVEIKEGPVGEFGVFDTATGEEIAHCLNRENAERVVDAFRDTARLDWMIVRRGTVLFDSGDEPDCDDPRADPPNWQCSWNGFEHGQTVRMYTGYVLTGDRGAIDDAITRDSASKATP